MQNGIAYYMLILMHDLINLMLFQNNKFAHAKFHPVQSFEVYTNQVSQILTRIFM